MKRITILSFTAAAGLFIAASAPMTTARPFNAAPEQETKAERFDLDFKGGTAAEYVAAIRRVRPEANIVLMPDAADVPMPATQLQSVTLGLALAPLDGHFARMGRDFVEVELRQHSDRFREVELYTIVADRRAEPATTEVYSVVDLLDGHVSSDDMLTAIETALGLLGDTYTEAQIRFHPETGILIARGHPEQIAAVKDVVQELFSAAERREKMKRRQAEFEEARSQAESHAARAVELEARLNESAMTLAEVETRLALVRDQKTRAETGLERCQAENRDLRARIQSLELTIVELKRAKDDTSAGAE